MEKCKQLQNIINIKGIYSIHYFEFNSEFSFHGESHDFWELVYIDKGEAIVTAGEKTLTLGEGEIIFHEPNEFHSIASNPQNPPNVFIITFESSSKSMRLFAERQISVPTPFRKYISEMVADGREAFHLTDDTPYSKGLVERREASVGSQQLIRLNLETLLIKLVRFFELPKQELSNSDGYDRLTREVIELLKNNIYGRLMVEELCRQLRFSRTYLSARFRKNTGKTIVEYFTELKISEAKYLIRKDNHTVAQISDFLCFENPQYFCRVFKKITNMTPTQYKNSVSYSKNT